MAKHYISWAVESSLNKIFNDCESVYREAHPELRDVVLTRSKIIMEIMRFYLQRTKLKVEE